MLNHALDTVRVEIDDQNFDEEHFLACIFENDFGIFGVTTKNVRREDHGEIIHIHFRDHNILRCSEYL